MHALFLFFALPAFAETPSLECRAIYRTLNERQQSVEEVAPLVLVSDFRGQRKYEAEVRGKAFFLTEEKGDLFGQIVAGPEYTKGTVFRGAADSSGRFTATEVVGTTVYRLECWRK